MNHLEDLLDQARDALVAGDLAALSGLDAQLTAAVETLAPLEAAAAQRLERKAMRNARLLQAAGRGVRAARDRFAEITAAPDLATYDSQGRKAALASPTREIGRY